MRAVVVPSWPLAMNSLQPSTAYPPTPTAWFFWHSPYQTLLLTVYDEFDLLDTSFLLNTTCLCLILQNPNSFFLYLLLFQTLSIVYSTDLRESEARCRDIRREEERERDMDEPFFWVFFLPTLTLERLLIYSL